MSLEQERNSRVFHLHTWMFQRAVCGCIVTANAIRPQEQTPLNMARCEPDLRACVCWRDLWFSLMSVFDSRVQCEHHQVCKPVQNVGLWMMFTVVSMADEWWISSVIFHHVNICCSFGWRACAALTEVQRVHMLLLWWDGFVLLCFWQVNWWRLDSGCEMSYVIHPTNLIQPVNTHASYSFMLSCMYGSCGPWCTRADSQSEVWASG